MKKCLIGFVGLYRTFPKTYLNVLEKVVKPNPLYEFDVMLNTEDVCRDRCKSWMPQKYYDVSSWKYEEKQKLEKDLMHVYGNLGVVKDMDFFEPEMNDKTSSMSVVCQRGGRLLGRTDKDYDKIIIIRFDVVLGKEIVLDDFDEKTFHFFSSKPYRERPGFVGSDFDYLYLGDKKSLGMYFNRERSEGQRTLQRKRELMDLTNTDIINDKILEHLGVVLNIIENGYNVKVETTYTPQIIR